MSFNNNSEFLQDYFIALTTRLIIQVFLRSVVRRKPESALSGVRIFMAHVREEYAFGGCGIFGIGAQVFQLFVSTGAISCRCFSKHDGYNNKYED